MTDNGDKPTLSNRQIAVLELVAKGLSNQEIARELDIQYNTVRVHVSNIFRIADVQSRTELAMWGIKWGFVTPDTGEAEILEQDEENAAPPPSLIIAKLDRWQSMYLVASVFMALFVVAVPAIKEVINPPKTEILEPVFDNRRWLASAEMPSARSRLSLLAYNGELFVIGGRRTSGATGLVEIYNPATTNWREGASKPTPTADLQGVVIGDKLYLAGGCTDSDTPTKVLEIYTPATNTWQSGKELPVTLCRYAATAYGDELYLIGGWDGRAYVDSVYVYNPQQNAWRLLAAPYPRKLGYLGAAEIDGRIYVAGGYDDQVEYSEVYVFDVASSTWSLGPSLQFPRGGLGLVAVDNTLYAIGGGWTTFLADNERLVIGEDVWHPIGSPYPQEWRNVGVAAIGTDIFIAGGWHGDYLNRVVTYRTVIQLFFPVLR